MVILPAGFAVVAERATAPPRFCPARSTACRLLLAAVSVPCFDPRPEGKGAGVQNAGMRASVGRLLHCAVSGLGLRGCCVGPLSLKSRDWSIGFGLYEDMEIALDFTVKITSGTRFPDRHGKLWLDLKGYVKMILLALRIVDG